MSGVNITVYDGKSAQLAAQRAEAAAREAKVQASITSGALTDPIPPGTESAPAVLPPGPAGQKVKFEPEPGFYQGFEEVTSDKRWYFYWNGTTWALVDMGELPYNPANSKQWTVGGYTEGSIVYHNGLNWRAVRDTSQEPSLGEDWEKVGYSDFETVEGMRLIDFQDNEGKSLASIDADGNLHAKFRDESIKPESIEGEVDLRNLISIIKNLIKQFLPKEIDGENLIEFRDSTGKLLGIYGKDGNLYTKFRDESIKPQSIEGEIDLRNKVDGIKSITDKLLPKEVDGANIFEFRDSLNNLLGVFDKDGNLYAKFRDEFIKLEKVQGGLDIKDYIDKLKITIDQLLPKEADGNNLLEIRDSLNKLIGVFDKEGNLHAKFRDESIKLKSVEEGLDIKQKIDNYLPTETRGSNLLEFKDSENRIFGFFDKEGTLNVTKIKELKPQVVDEKNYTIFQGRTLYIPNQTFMRVDLYGRDAGNDDLKTKGVMSLSASGVVYATLNVEWSRQGNASALWNPKQLSIDFYNDNWEAVEIKFGDWIPTDGLHLKAYRTDLTNTRDGAQSRIWRQMADTRPFPENHIAPLGVSPTITTWNRRINATADAKFVSDTIPCEVYLNGKFRNLGSWKIKKTRENWAIDRDLPSQDHWFLDAHGKGSLLHREYASWEEFEDDYWEVKSPRSPSEDTKAKILDWFEWVRNVLSGEESLIDTYEDRINIHSAIDYLICTNLFNHWDTGDNNMLLASYDGATMHFFLHDMDQTLGTAEGSLTDNGYGLFTDAGPFFTLVRTTFTSMVRERWTYLRNKGIISNENFIKVYRSIASHIPPKVYEEDLRKNGASYATLGTGQIQDINQIYRYLNSRVSFLDGFWLIND